MIKYSYKKISPILIFLSFIYLFSCNDNEDVEPELTAEIVAEWELVEQEIIFYKESGEVDSDRSFKHIKDTDQWSSTWDTYLAIYENGSFIHYEIAGDPSSDWGALLSDILPSEGTWEYKENNTILNFSGIQYPMDFTILESTNNVLKLHYTRDDNIQFELILLFKK